MNFNGYSSARYTHRRSIKIHPALMESSFGRERSSFTFHLTLEAPRKQTLSYPSNKVD